MRGSGNIKLIGFVLVFIVIALVIGGLGKLRSSSAVSAGGTLKDLSLTQADINASEQAQLLIAKANQFLARMKDISATQGVKFVGSSSFVPTSGRILQFSWEDYTGPEFQLDSTDYSFNFWQNTNHLHSFYNKAYEKFLSAQPLLDKPDVPSASVQDGRKMAKAFLPLIEVAPDIILEESFGRFTPQDELPKYRLGYWYIGWSRMDNDHHIIGGDIGVTMNLPEGFAPSSLAAGLAVPYAKEEGEPISKEAALAKARAEIAASRSGLRFTLIPTDKGIVDDSVVSSTLEVVEAPEKTSWWSFKSEPKQRARLAWVFWFEPVFNPPITGPTYNHKFEISVDAHTGEIDGTDAML